MITEVDPYGDPRLVALYDDDNPAGPDHDFFRRVADQLQSRTIVDLGCGTGLLTVTLAQPGRSVVGADPSSAMLLVARNRPGGDRVGWVRGDAGVLSADSCDLVIMSGNVAQHLIGSRWTQTLAAIERALRPGGTLVFESRNPAARAWDDWTMPRTLATRAIADGPLTEWLEVTEVIDSTESTLVTFVAHNVFGRTGEHATASITLAFRSADLLRGDLAAAGFGDVDIRGGWQDEALGRTSAQLVVRAARVALT